MRRTSLSILVFAACFVAPRVVLADPWNAEIVRVERARFTSANGVRLRLQIQAKLLDGETVSLVPIDVERVRELLTRMRAWDGPALPLRIYCLPGIPEGIGSSFAEGNEVFLAANLAHPSDDVLSYTIAHEIGHVVQHLRMPGRSGRQWLRYWELRGLDPAIHRDDARHRDRPAEIFAEDFRAIFGGPAANSSGTLENPDLLWTAEVAGLEQFFVELPSHVGFDSPATATNYPNPFNPITTIRAELSEDMLVPGARVRIELFDLRGRRVFRFPPKDVSPVVEAIFHGLDENGRALASGVYLVSIRVGERSVSGRMTLLK